LRSPLKTIDCYLAMLEEQLGGKLDELGQRVFNVVRGSSRRMGTLIDEMLAFSKLGRQPMRAGKIDMTLLANEAWAELRMSSPSGTPDFRLQMLPLAWGDHVLLRQVWLNLLSNAVKYSSKVDRPAIEVSAETSSNQVTYCVRDNGAGFDMRHYDKLFEVFHRLHSDYEFPGTGVGLAIVQRVVARHGGRVWAKGEVNSGAAFFFSLPLADMPQEE
jgi:light-regulated signal transduction histidine kinase (bacteriophytochrome)